MNLAYFQQKKKKNSRKLKKSLFWTRFELILEQTRNFLKKFNLPIFSVSRFLVLCNISEKLISQFQEKLVTDKRTDGQA